MQSAIWTASAMHRVVHILCCCITGHKGVSHETGRKLQVVRQQSSWPPNTNQHTAVEATKRKLCNPSTSGTLYQSYTKEEARRCNNQCASRHATNHAHLHLGTARHATMHVNSGYVQRTVVGARHHVCVLLVEGRFCWHHHLANVPACHRQRTLLHFASLG